MIDEQKVAMQTYIHVVPPKFYESQVVTCGQTSTLDELYMTMIEMDKKNSHRVEGFFYEFYKARSLISYIYIAYLF